MKRTKFSETIYWGEKYTLAPYLILNAAKWTLFSDADENIMFNFHDNNVVDICEDGIKRMAHYEINKKGTVIIKDGLHVLYLEIAYFDKYLLIFRKEGYKEFYVFMNLPLANELNLTSVPKIEDYLIRKGLTKPDEKLSISIKPEGYRGDDPKPVAVSKVDPPKVEIQRHSKKKRNVYKKIGVSILIAMLLVAVLYVPFKAMGRSSLSDIIIFLIISGIGYQIIVDLGHRKGGDDFITSVMMLLWTLFLGWFVWHVAMD